MKILLVFLAGLCAVACGAENYGVYVGELETLAHDVFGMVYVVDNNRIRIRNFVYDGQGPDAFFYMGNKNGGPAAPSDQGTIMLDQYGRTSKLDAYVNADLVLTLPGSATVEDINWISVWCRQAGANFAQLYFPDSFDVPAVEMVGMFSDGAHDVESGDITVLDERTIMIKDFHYDGVAPDTFFWVGNGVPDEEGEIVPLEDGSMMKLAKYEGEDVTIILPYDLTVNDVDYLSVWCQTAKESFAHITLNNDLMVPPHTMHIEGYYGKLIGNLTTLTHDVEGTVYLMNNKMVRIRNFFYDGLGPDARVWVGNTEKPSEDGEYLEIDGAASPVLGKFENGEITVSLPDGKVFTDLRWISIWCADVKVDFGNIMIPEGYIFGTPEPQEIGSFIFKAHSVRSGKVTILDAKTILIENFNYDGRGPDAFFYVGTGVNPNTATGMKIPDEKGSLVKAGRYEEETITLTLPEGITFLDIDWLSMYCISFSENFGHISIPDNLNVPGHLMTQIANCEQVHDFFNVGWEIDGDYINFEFTGALEGEFGYMAFGLSGSDSGSVMGGGDVIVVSYMNGEPVVEDFLLNQYSQCSNGNGVCVDTVQGGSDNIEDVEGYQVDGITSVTFRRMLNTGDSKDKVYSISEDMYIIWAMGLINENSMLVTKHNIRLRDDTMFNFGRDPLRRCPPVMSRNPPAEADPWKIPVLYANPMETIEVSIGSSGPQERGYGAITGTESWGIAWYVNDWLIPEIVVERGKTYTFMVSGGDDPAQSASYHPFYITNDPQGGHSGKTEDELTGVVIYAGPQEGQFCEFKETDASTEMTDTFEEYFDTLNKECTDGSGPGMLQWTPNHSTPDTVYYQCYTHRYLGYKITVVDQMVSEGTRPGLNVHMMTALMLAIVALLGVM